MPKTVKELFVEIENALVSRVSLNLSIDADKEAKIWEQTQEKLLKQFDKAAHKEVDGKLARANKQIVDELNEAYASGTDEGREEYEKALKQGFEDIPVRDPYIKRNERTYEAVLKAVTSDFEKAEYAMFRRAKDQYRKIIYNSVERMARTNSNLQKAIDDAAYEFFSNGINCIEYKNGAMVNIVSYSEMAVRTAVKRSTTYGASKFRDTVGVNTVMVNYRSCACPLCINFVGNVFYDDVYSSMPTPDDGRYPLLSSAINDGLFHPNCQDGLSSFYEGINEPREMTEEEKEDASATYKEEQRKKYIDRNANKYKRLAENALDKENRMKYRAKENEWRAKK